jgi:U3 small nucleolar RNA-associated protein 18
LPIFSANFSPDGKQIVITGRRNFFYVLDLDAGSTQRIHSIQGRDEKSLEKSYISKCGEYLCVLGKDGFVIILSMKTKRWIGNVKMNATAVSLTFTKTHLWSVSLDGSVYQWDLKTLQCTHRFTDQGCIKATVISISDDEKWIAIGSQVGVVNVYSMSSCTLTETPEPTKVLMNLTTAITSLVFHPSSDLLAFGSHDIKDAFRLYHLPSQKVVKNWPTNNTPLGYVSSVDFSPSGKYIAIGNAKGKVILYRLEAFSK